MNTGPLIAMGLILALLASGAIRSIFGYWLVRRDAKQEWKLFQRSNAKEAFRTDEQQFIAAYCRAHSPRGLAYSTSALAVAVLVTPLAVMLLTWLYANGIVQEVDPNAPPATTVAEEVRRQFRSDGPLVYSFFLFFGLIGSWGAVAYVTARLYHRDGRFEMDEELREIRGDAPLPKGKAGRKRPKWSPLVQTNDGLALQKDSDATGAKS
ncbi:hypothetical protein MNBD_ALPHA06-1184 [hydrothermal vent metagenome]|uniref:Uncharacterized protein n=1 Tax=hydrothermal vent metagenome TaxID=652676 RepID=A0A3B0S7I8_9ZZZZ